MNRRQDITSISPAEKPDGDDSDRELVARCQKGDRAAFRALFVRYQRRAYVLALGVVHNPDQAMDVVQEAFLKAYRYLADFEGNAAFYTWFYRITMNVAIDHLRKHNRLATVDYNDAVAHEQDDGPEEALPLPQLSRGNPLKELERSELRDKMQEALGRLSANHRAVLVMREIDGLSYEEMAKVMQCSKGTIMSRLFHARRYMQKSLSALLPELELKKP